MRVTVTVPKDVNEDNARKCGDFGENRAWVAAVPDVVKKRMAGKFGGFTAYDAAGGWVDGDGNLIEEPVTVIESYTGDDETAPMYARCIALEVLNMLYQDAAMYTIDGTAHFVEKDW